MKAIYNILNKDIYNILNKDIYDIDNNKYIISIIRSSKVVFSNNQK